MAVGAKIDVTRRLFTVDEYVRMWEDGIFGPEERLELIEGEILQMSPAGDRHIAFVVNLTHLLVQAVGDRARVSPQNAVRIPPYSAPEPDFAVVRPRSYVHESLTAADVLLVVEVADTSLRYDRTTKLRIYARAGIAEYWIVDANAEAIDVHSSPTEDGYGEHRRLGRGDRIAPRALPDAVIDVAAIFV
jgi:Uma2 family endonuclease